MQEVSAGLTSIERHVEHLVNDRHSGIILITFSWYCSA